LAVLGWVFVIVLLMWAVFLADASVVELVRLRASGWSRWLAGRVSYWGDWYGVAGIGGLLWLAGRRPGWARLQKLVLVMGLCAAVSGISANVIRSVSGRARPFTSAAPGWYGPGPGLKVWSRGARDFQSFPSAHTSVVAGFCAPLALAALASRRRRVRFLGVLAAAGGTGLMAWARVWAGAHHLSDVVAASLLGLVVGMILLRKGTRLRGFAFLPESG
jgi:membrane-associated phospholipid phosphatase